MGTQYVASDSQGPRRRRSEFDIIAAMLDSAMNSQIKTKIMYDAFLSFTQLDQYLSLLVERGLLKKIPAPINLKTKEVFKTTYKGIKYLQSYTKMRNLLGRDTDKRNALSRY